MFLSCLAGSCFILATGRITTLLFSFWEDLSAVIKSLFCWEKFFFPDTADYSTLVYQTRYCFEILDNFCVFFLLEQLSNSRFPGTKLVCKANLTTWKSCRWVDYSRGPQVSRPKKVTHFYHRKLNQLMSTNYLGEQSWLIISIKDQIGVVLFYHSNTWNYHPIFLHNQNNLNAEL